MMIFLSTRTPSMLTQATYIWLDGAKPTKKLRSKTRILPNSSQDSMRLEDFPEWDLMDLQLTKRGRYSDLILKPVSFIKNPLLPDENYLVLCEVYNPDHTPHKQTLEASCANYSIKAQTRLVWVEFDKNTPYFRETRH